MALTRNKWLFRLGVLLILFFVSSFLISILLKKKIVSYISNLPSSVQLKYDDIHVNSFFGNLEIDNLSLKVYNNDSSQLQMSVHAHKIEAKSLSYFNLIVRDKIKLKGLALDHVDGQYIQFNTAPKTDNTNKNGGLFDSKVSIGKITIKDSKLKIKEHQVDTLVLGVNDLNLEIINFKINPNWANNDDSLMTYDGISCSSRNIKIKASPYDDISVDKMIFKDDRLIMSEFELKTKYTRDSLSRILKTERDHFDITTDSIVFNAFNIGMGKSNRFYVSADSAQILNPSIKVFRDKLVNDSYTIRPLYGKMLRDLGIDLGIDQLKISNGMLSYSEKVKAKSKGGQLDFYELNTRIERLGNIYEKDTTTINFKADFMGRTHLDINWKFIVQNPSDDFSFSGELDYFKVEEISRFTRPNLNVDFKGELKKTYFNINGNPYYSDIDLQVNFEDFQVIVLRKNSRERNKFWSGLVNMIVSTDSDKNPNHFYHGNVNKVERDRTKSIFNFVWKSLEAGFLSAMIGNGKKKK